MAKITLGKRPETFKKVISFPMLDGSTGRISVDYVYRTKTEFAELMDKAQAGGKKTFEEAGERKELETQEQVAELGLELDARYFLQIVKGWDLDIELDEKSVIQLGNEFPLAHSAIVESYRIACVEGRLGN